MHGFPHARRFLARALRGLVGGVALLGLAASAANAEATPPAKPDPSEPGAYCAIGECRPVSASLWTPLAFAATVVVIGRRGHRGAPRS